MPPDLPPLALLMGLLPEQPAFAPRLERQWESCHRRPLRRLQALLHDHRRSRIGLQGRLRNPGRFPNARPKNNPSPLGPHSQPLHRHHNHLLQAPYTSTWQRR